MAPKMKWALCWTWQQVREFATKKEAQAALVEWAADMELDGWTITGSVSQAKWARQGDIPYQEDMERASQGIAPLGVKVAYVKRLEEVRFATD